jgi:hypothetical protein
MYPALRTLRVKKNRFNVTEILANLCRNFKAKGLLLGRLDAAVNGNPYSAEIIHLKGFQNMIISVIRA